MPGVLLTAVNISGDTPKVAIDGFLMKVEVLIKFIKRTTHLRTRLIPLGYKD